MSAAIPSRTPLSKQERNRKIKAIYREMEAKKRELGLKAPVVPRGPVFYLVVLMGLALIGGLVIQAAGKGGEKKMRDGNLVRTEQSVAALAEALGRYKFHCGAYPTAEEGLEALAEKFSTHAGWIGPYAERILPDPWKHPYEDTSWTNDWVYFSRRGIVVVPTQEEKEKLLKEGMRDR